MSEFQSDISGDRNKEQLLNQKELEKQREQITLLTKLQLGSLSDDVISSYLSKNHELDLNNFDEINKKRFLEEIRLIFSGFKDFDESMVTRLKEIRESMSFGLESGKSNEYYRGMILSNKINTRIIVLQESLKTINGERIKVGNTEYNKEEYGSFKTGIQDLDNKNGLNLFSKVDLENYGFSFKQAFTQEIKGKVDKSNPKYGLIISDLIRLSQVTGDKGFENLKEVKLTDGKTINLEELFKEYNKVYTSFKIKNKVFEFGNKQLVKSDNGFGFNDAKYGLGYDQLENAYEDNIQDVEKMGVTDLVIMLRVLFGIVPVAGDFVGGIDDIRQAKSSINFDGSIQGIPENLLGYITGVLGVSIVGGKLATVMKGEKLAEVMITMNKVIDRLGKLPDLGELAKNEKVIKLLESIKGIIPKVEELLGKIKNIGKTEVNSGIIGAEKLSFTKDSQYFNSHFSDEIPENLKSQNPLAWIDKLGEIHYNKLVIEQKFGVKITVVDGKTLFDGKILKNKEILDYLKELKAHEVSHRILEVYNIKDLKLGEKIYSQEDICNIIDGSKILSKDELQLLESLLKEKIGEDFLLLKDGQINSDFMRKFDTKTLVRGGDFSRESEVAKGSHSLEKLLPNVTEIIKYNGPITIYLGEQKQVIQIIKTSDLPNGNEYNTPFLIIQSDIFNSSGGKSGYKGLREGETFSLGRKSGRFDFNSEISREHVNISLLGGEIKIMDKGSTNGTFILRESLNKPSSNIQRKLDIDGKSNKMFRNNEVMAIGDLHGSIDALWANLDSLGVIDSNKKWIGGDRKIVFHGDILGDRNTQGIQILQEIDKIKSQAKQSGGDISVLAGNHDDFAISFLIGKPYAGWDGRGSGKFYDYGGQAEGVHEFIRFIPKGSSLNGNEALQTMRKSQEGVKILENICNMKLIEQIDDTLFTHTDITGEMADLILKYGVININKIYQDGLKRVLLGGENYYNLNKDFTYLVDIFLNTNNRKNLYMSERHGEFLKSKGINTVIHGHSNHKGETQQIGGVLVKSVDNSSFKKGVDDGNRSVGIIRQDGNIQVGPQKLSINGGIHGEYPKLENLIDSSQKTDFINSQSVIDQGLDSLKQYIPEIRFKEIVNELGLNISKFIKNIKQRIDIGDDIKQIVADFEKMVNDFIQKCFVNYNRLIESGRNIEYKVGDLVEFSMLNGDQFNKGKIVKYIPEKEQYLIKTDGINNEYLVPKYYITDKVGGLNTLPYGHGSSSASLLGVIREKGLIPTGDLMKKGIIPFSGAIDSGIGHERGVNNHSLSLSFKGGERHDYIYANNPKNVKGWSLEEGNENILRLKELIRQNSDSIDTLKYYETKLKIEEMRKYQFYHLNEFEKKLITTPFPIIYKISEPHKGDIVFKSGEAYIPGGVDIMDIKGILVPKDKIPLVKGILKDANITYIRVEELI